MKPRIRKVTFKSLWQFKKKSSFLKIITFNNRMEDAWERGKNLLSNYLSTLYTNLPMCGRENFKIAFKVYKHTDSLAGCNKLFDFA